ncbi:hypothetical protein A6768_12685 [Sphingobium yanoikuyae]|uniref:Uncharacterized protein n=1 Tax=Sphingobium yanoikuyae TaxID=13690 RepID=A0A291N078_SPHYA|nr:hypothetical protein A6768_12685 [Sphingobium yanoikuyae]
MMRSPATSGPDGCHVNKTHSAERATYRPAGLVAPSQEQRSKSADRTLAGQTNDGALGWLWQVHQNLERGNAARVYARPH